MDHLSLISRQYLKILQVKVSFDLKTQSQFTWYSLFSTVPFNIICIVLWLIFMSQNVIVSLCVALSFAVWYCLSSIRTISVNYIPAFVHVFICEINIWDWSTLSQSIENQRKDKKTTMWRLFDDSYFASTLKARHWLSSCWLIIRIPE